MPVSAIIRAKSKIPRRSNQRIFEVGGTGGGTGGGIFVPFTFGSWQSILVKLEGLVITGGPATGSMTGCGFFMGLASSAHTKFGESSAIGNGYSIGFSFESGQQFNKSLSGQVSPDTQPPNSNYGWTTGIMLAHYEGGSVIANSGLGTTIFGNYDTLPLTTAGRTLEGPAPYPIFIWIAKSGAQWEVRAYDPIIGWTDCKPEDILWLMSHNEDMAAPSLTGVRNGLTDLVQNQYGLASIAPAAAATIKSLTITPAVEPDGLLMYWKSNSHPNSKMLFGEPAVIKLA